MQTGNVILLIIIILAAIAVILAVINRSKKTDSKDDGVSVNNKDEAAPRSEVQTVGADLSDEELVAVLTAAVSACMKPGIQSKIMVKSFRRIDTETPIWNSVGRFDRIRTKL